MARTWTLQLCLLAALAATAGSCRLDEEARDGRADAVDDQVRRKWGRPLADLPIEKLVLISPHNENIEKEFAWAFSLHHALEHGSRVELEWRDVGGGTTSIEQYLLNVYGQNVSPGIDVMWGGGEFTFRNLASAGLLVKLTLGDDVLANVPVRHGGVEMYDGELRWIGSAVSGFGFLYNETMLSRCGRQPPRQWADLSEPGLAGLVTLADPMQSGSAASAYRMIVVSRESWPAGWAELLDILSNANRFTGSAGEAANAPLLGEALVAACIDFYGALRVAEAPDDLTYVSPRGQTTFSPDPIAVLKDPPHEALARRFVDFVMSRRGQALWALPPGEPDGPVRSALGRQPIRPDVYEAYRGRLLPYIVNPYEAGAALEVSAQMDRVSFSVLRQLVGAAAIDNAEDLRAARRRLIELDFPPALLAEMHRLPDNVDELGDMPDISRRLKDPTEAERVVTDWQSFFHQKYRRIAEAER